MVVINYHCHVQSIVTGLLVYDSEKPNCSDIFSNSSHIYMDLSHDSMACDYRRTNTFVKSLKVFPFLLLFTSGNERLIRCSKLYLFHFCIALTKCIFWGQISCQLIAVTVTHVSNITYTPTMCFYMKLWINSVL